MAGVGTIRRYLLLKEAAAWRRGENGMALAFRGKRSEESGTDLPVDFPALTKLPTLVPPYLLLQDLLGPTLEQSTDVEELVEAGLSRKEASAVMAALEELL